MATTLSLKAQEDGTYIIHVNFKDENNDDVVPTSIKWTLSDIAGAIINSRDQVAIAPGDLTANLYVVLAGDDLQTLSQSCSEKRLFTIEALYDTIIDGDSHSDMPLNGAAEFEIENITVI